MKPRILVVDDSDTIRTSVVGMLREHFECVTASNGQEALLEARRQAPAAVVADLEMPGMDGVALLRELRKDAATRELPVIIATSVTAVDLINECHALGCTGFVLKPISREYLLAKLNRVLQKRSATPEGR